MSNQVQKIIDRSEDPKQLMDVFEFARQAYGDRKRYSGEFYLEHAVKVAGALNQMRLDQTTIIGAILHDVIDTHAPAEKKSVLMQVESRFGQEVATLVERASDLNRIYYSYNIAKNEDTFFAKDKAENLRKMFLAIAQDLRVVLIELASVIDGLHSIEALPKEKQRLYAIETLQIFSPIANRLGLGEIKTTLEDLSFSHLDPDKFKWLQDNIKEKYEERRRYLKRFIPHLKKIFRQEKIPVIAVDWRAKSYWSAYQKLLSHNMDFERIHDLVALRIIVNDVATCYKALGIIHKYYQPISQEINDYIAKPKSNGYQSLHTTVFLENKISEVQIRTAEMNHRAQYGVCAHWSYKEKVDLQKEGEKFSWTKKIPEFWKTFSIDFFADQVFAFTPKGDVIVLPKGSTPVDFAYAVHSDIGNHCESAKIDGKIITLDQVLKNGDVVEIITNKKRKPSQDWIRFVKTNFAKSHIKKVITSIPLSLFSVPRFVTKKIIEISAKAKQRKQEKLRIKKQQPNQIYLAGQKSMMVTFAKCCNAKPGEATKAYLTKYRAAVLHKITCKNLQAMAKKFPEKIIDASWEQS